tara:strand:- start:748 stop:1572 length:825 start_codon:yes stop_codon:yes gene_type:complete
MTTKENLYFSPINNSSLLEHIIFNFKLIIFIILTIFLISFSFLFGKIIPLVDKWLPVFFHKILLWVLSIEVEIVGEINHSKKSNLFISNHLSYLDVPIMGSNFPLRFVAKSEVENWPLFGFLAKRGRSIFIKRNKTDSVNQKNKILDLLSSREKVFIFPEGTTSDGNRVLKFKSSSFSSVEKQNFTVQPIVIIYSDLNGIPINRWLRPIIAWYGDMDLKPHLSKVVGLMSIKVKLIYLEPVKTQSFKNRKDLSNYLEYKIRKVYSSALSKKLAK